MKKWRRILLRSLAGLSLATATLLVVCLDSVDHRPYFREPYYAETTGRLRAEAATHPMARGELSAGFGRAKLTPTVNAAQDDPTKGQFRNLPLAGYGNRHGRSATGVHDDLFVKAVALRVGTRLGIMVGADALIIPPEVTVIAVHRLSQELGLRREQIYLSATHTHCGIGGWGEGIVAEQFAGKFQPGARTWFADRIVTAVREAVADLKPASIGQGSFSAPEFVRNRLVGDLGKVDPEFSYALLKQMDGRLAVLGSYSAHATILSGNMMDFSADYPGCWQRAMEEATGGTAVFLAGEVGSTSPAPSEKGFAGAEKIGRALAQKTLDSFARISWTNSIEFGLLGFEVTMPPLNVRITDSVRLRPWLAAKLLPVPRHSYLQAFRLNQTIWISTPCDFSGELALGIKDQINRLNRHAVITSFNGDYVGYVILPRYYHMNGYEPRTMSFFGPNVPEYFDELIRTMAAGLSAQGAE
ncbi:MAG: neutral/alkaline non-lysosomal ceramidase N-terminal domain-containing protein [Verrucomicrobiota bacterium]